MMTFLELRCPNRPYPDNDRKECRSRLQGPALDSVLASLRAGVPYVDTRYCTHCKMLWRVTIDSEHSPPVYESIPRGEKVDSIADTDAFGVTGAAGRKITRKASVA